MGNLILYPRSKTSLTEVTQNLKTLTNCNDHKGTREEILKIYKSYVFYITKHFYISRSELRRISRHTSLEGIEEIIFTYFSKAQHKKVNIMEILAAIITFSFADWEQKIILGIQIFDFDGSKNLTEDEFFIMSRCFLTGISIMTGGNAAENEVIRFFSTSLFAARSELTIPELVVWVRQNPILYEVFQVNQPSTRQKEPKKKIRFENIEHKTFDSRQPKIIHRRVQSSFYHKRDDNLSVIIDSKIVTKKEINELKAQFDKHSKNGLCLIKDLYQSIGSFPLRGSDYNLNSYISFTVLIDHLFPRASKNQQNRLLRFIGETVKEVQSDTEKPLITKVVDPKLVKTFKNMFNEYDTNKDGTVDLKELKIALKSIMTEIAIEGLYDKYYSCGHGLTLKEFIKMHIPENTEIPDI